jgi:hypothetical protein
MSLKRVCLSISHRRGGIPTNLLRNRGTYTLTRPFCCFVSVLLFAAFSVAQSADRVEIFGGYSIMTPDFTGSVPKGASGWNVSGTVNFPRHFGIVAEISGFSPSGSDPCASCGGGSFAHYHAFLGGPQASIRLGPIKPFAHFVMGQTWGSLTHADSQFGGDFSYFTYGAGGGADFTLNRWFAIRAQADLLHVGSPGNVARISTGLVFRF